jgi:hypothetical protein
VSDGDRKVGYDEAVRITGLRKGVLYKLVRSNQIPHYRISKHSTVFSVRELGAWLVSRRAGRAHEPKQDVSGQQRGARGRWIRQEARGLKPQLKHRASSPTAITPLEPSRERKKPMPPVMHESGGLLMGTSDGDATMGDATTKTADRWLGANTEGQLECSCEDCQWAGSESRRVRSSVPSSMRPSPPVSPSVKPEAMSSRDARQAYLTSVARVMASVQVLGAQLLAIVCPLCGESCGGACVTGARTTGARDADAEAEAIGKTSTTT